MKKHVLKTISLLMVVVTVIVSLPLSAFANNVNRINNETVKVEKSIYYEDVEARDATSKTFIMSDGTKTQVTYGAPVHFYSNDSWTEYDNELVTTKNGFTVKSSDKTIEFDKNRVSYLIDDIRFELLNEGEFSCKPIEGEKIVDDYLPDNMESKLAYNSKNLNFEYTINSTGIKENIVLNSKTDFKSCDFKIDVKKYKVKVDKDTIRFVCEDGTDYELSSPFMYDSDYNVSYDVKYELKQTSDTDYILSIIPDTDWIENAQYPVVIDPSIKASTNYFSLVDAYVGSAEPNRHYSNTPSVSVGKTKEYEYRTLIDINSLPSMQYNGTPVSATLNYSKLAGSLLASNCYAYEITSSSWDASTVTWNTQPTYSNEIIDYGSYSNLTMTFDITKAAKDIYFGTSPCSGVMLCADSSANATALMQSLSGNSTHSYITVNFRSNLGIEDTQSYTTVSINDSDTVYCDNSNGDYTIISNDVSAKDEKSLLNIYHVYNSNLNDKDFDEYMRVGKGWMLNIQKQLNPVDQNIEYVDDDGTIHYLIPDIGNCYIEENDGSIKVEAVENGYVLTNDNGKEYYYNCGYLYREEDNNGNYINYIYDDDTGYLVEITDSTDAVVKLTYNNSYLHELYLNPDVSLTNYDMKLTYNYDSSGRLVSLSNSNYTSDQISYSYLGNSYYLNSINDIRGKEILLSYRNNNLNSINWRYADTEQYNGIDFTFNGGCSSYVRYYGDDITPNTNDDIISYYTFDYYGRAISGVTLDNNNTILSNSLYRYADNSTVGTYSKNISVVAEADYTAPNLLSNTAYFVSNGSTGVQNHSSESVLFNNFDYTTYVLSGWARASSASNSNSKFELVATVYYVDNNGTTCSIDTVVPFNRETSANQFASGVITLPERSTVSAISSITVSANYDYNVNQALFYDLSLRKGSSLKLGYNGNDVNEIKSNENTVYEEITDANGNVISRKDDKCEIEHLYYNNGVLHHKEIFEYDETASNNHSLVSVEYYDADEKIISVTDANNNIIESNTYSNGKLVESIIDNVTTQYNLNGDVTGSSTTVNGLTLSTSATFDTITGLKTSETDSRGNTTYYGYTTESLLSYIEDANSVRTAYTYNANGETTSVYTDLDKDGAADVNESNIQYTYDCFGNPTTIVVGGEVYTFEYNAASLISEIKIGNVSLVTYNYNPAYDKLSSLSYANGFTKSYVYDILGNVRGYSENNVLMCSYQYDANGNLIRKKDYKSNLSTKYVYADGSLVETKIFEFVDDDTIDNNDYASDGSFINGYYEEEVLSYSVDEDTSANTSVVTINIGGVVQTYTTESNSSGDLLRYILPNASSIERTTDDFNRESSIVLKDSSGNNILTTEYSYETFTVDGVSRTSEYVSSLSYTKKNEASSFVTYTYTYDNVGNILSVSDGTNTTSYSYDSNNELVRENNQRANKTWTYTYDLNGNILSKNEYAYTTGTLGAVVNTVTYSYTNAEWKDQLTSYNGTEISYDSLGNPLTWKNGESLIWSGRILESFGNVDFEYDSDGILQSVNDSVYTYDADGRVLTTPGLQYYYDENGTPVSVTVRGVTCNYVYNKQGDVTKIIRESNGAVVVEYEYDAWGNIIYSTSSTTIGSRLISNNIYRYRGAYGYVYERYSGLYYLKTRFYDPTVGRFLNADDTDYLDVSGTPLGCNLYTYCESNPVSSSDLYGNLAIRVVTALVGGICAVVSYIIVGALKHYFNHNRSFRGYSVSGWRLAWEFFWGFVSGLFVPSGFTRTQMAMIGGALGALQSVLSSLRKGSNFKKTLESVISSFISSCILALLCGPGVKSKLNCTITFKNKTPIIKAAKVTFEANSYNLSVVSKELWKLFGSFFVSNISSEV